MKNTIVSLLIVNIFPILLVQCTATKPAPFSADYNFMFQECVKKQESIEPGELRRSQACQWYWLNFADDLKERAIDTALASDEQGELEEFPVALQNLYDEIAFHYAVAKSLGRWRLNILTGLKCSLTQSALILKISNLRNPDERRVTLRLDQAMEAGFKNYSDCGGGFQHDVQLELDILEFYSHGQSSVSSLSVDCKSASTILEHQYGQLLSEKFLTPLC